MVFHQRVPCAYAPELQFTASVDLNGSLILSAQVPEELEPRVMVAMRNSREKKCYRDGVLEICLHCLRKSTQEERESKLETFCRWLQRRSDITISAVLI